MQEIKKEPPTFKIKIRKLYISLKKTIELSFALAKSSFKLKNEGSYLGIMWYLLEPLILFSIIMFIKGVAFSHTKIEFYPIYLLFGIVMNNLFNGIIGSSIGAIENNASFIKSMKIKLEPFILANVLQYTFSHLFEVGLIAIFMIFYKISLFGLIYYFLILALFIIFLTGVSFLFSTIGTYVSDFNNIWKFAAQLIFFITPTFYAIKPGDANYLLNLFNPLFYYLTIARDAVIYERIPEIWMVLIAIGISFGFFVLGLFVFEKFKKKFPELI